MNKIGFLILFIFLFIGCKTVSIQNELHSETSENIMLGVVGENKQFILERDYNHTAIPKYNEAVKVQIEILKFDKHSYKLFLKANTTQSKTIEINYVDNLDQKPQFLKIEIADRVAILNALNDKENLDVFQFLENKKESHLVTSISIALNENDIEAINNADEVFLEMVGKKSYALKTYINKEVQETILFNQGVVFAYQTSNFCWQQNDKRQLEIVDLVESNDKCPNKTYKSSKRAIKKIDYYDF